MKPLDELSTLRCVVCGSLDTLSEGGHLHLRGRGHEGAVVNARWCEEHCASKENDDREHRRKTHAFAECPLQPGCYGEWDPDDGLEVYSDNGDGEDVTPICSTAAGPTT